MTEENISLANTSYEEIEGIIFQEQEKALHDVFGGDESKLREFKFHVIKAMQCLQHPEANFLAVVTNDETKSVWMPGRTSTVSAIILADVFGRTAMQYIAEGADSDDDE